MESGEESRSSVSSPSQANDNADNVSNESNNQEKVVKDLSDISDLDDGSGTASLTDNKPTPIVETKENHDMKKDFEEELDFEAEEEVKEETEAKEKAEEDVAADVVEKSEKSAERESGEELDLEDGEVTDANEKRAEEPERSLCRFFTRGQCTWGMSCRFLHPGVNDKGQGQGNYRMFDLKRPVSVPRSAPPLMMPAPYDYRYDRPMYHMPPHFFRPYQGFAGLPSRFGAAPDNETAWERGLRGAKEMMRNANRRKDQNADYDENKINSFDINDEAELEKYYYERQSPENLPRSAYRDRGARVPLYSPPPHKKARYDDEDEDQYGRVARHYRELPTHRMPHFENEDSNRRRPRMREVVLERATTSDDWNDPWMRKNRGQGSSSKKSRKEREGEKRSYTSSESSYNSSNRKSRSRSRSSSESSNSRHRRRSRTKKSKERKNRKTEQPKPKTTPQPSQSEKRSRKKYESSSSSGSDSESSSSSSSSSSKFKRKHKPKVDTKLVSVKKYEMLKTQAKTTPPSKEDGKQKPSTSKEKSVRREELLKQLKIVQDALEKKRSNQN